ncbi:MAG: helix-turn-helix domain-containing protein [Candidatus Gastranaerophilaceae bacterium]
MSQSNKTQILKKLGANIRQLRLKKNLSQEELAFQINSARNFIGCIERAEKNSSVITLCRISNALGVSLSELVKDIDTL